MASLRRKPAQQLELDRIYLAGTHDREGFWTDEAQSQRPISSRQNISELEAVARPANDPGHPRRRGWIAPPFTGSRPFWMALGGTTIIALLAAWMSGAGNGPSLAALLSNPGQHSGLLTAIAMGLGAVWMLALSAHRQNVSNDALNRMLRASRRFEEPNVLAEDVGHRVSSSFDQVFAEIDARMALLDERSAQLGRRIEEAMRHSSAAADVSAASMQGILDASETQCDALKRTSMMISTEILPVLSKLETTVLSLDAVAQTAGGTLETIGGRLQQSTQDLKACLDSFNSANHTVVPDIERRMMRFEAAVGQLPEQLEATIGRLAPMAETVADAAMLSTANIEVIDQLSKDITAALDASRRTFGNLSATGAALLQDAVEAHASGFREVLAKIVSEEAARVSGLTQELDLLADTAAAVVNRLQQPVTEIASVADRTLSGVNASIGSLEERVEASVSARMADLNEAATRAVQAMTRDVEASTTGLQTRLAAAATEVMQRFDADASRFEGIIAESAERASSRIATAIHDLPNALSHRMDSEVARVDGALKGSLLGLTEQMRQVVDAVPNRFSSVMIETLHRLEHDLQLSFDSVVRRSESLGTQFRENATQTAETVLQSYVDFIFLSTERFRKELEAVNDGFTRQLEETLAGLPTPGRDSLPSGEMMLQPAVPQAIAEDDARPASPPA